MSGLSSRLQTISFFLPGTITVANDLIEFKLPANNGLTLVGVSTCAQTLNGGTTSFDVDVKDDGVEIAAAAGRCSVAGTPGFTDVTFASYANRHIAGGSIVGLDLNANGGTQASNIAIVLYVVWDG